MIADLTGLDYHIHKLSLESGDVLVFSCQEWLTREQQAEVRQKLKVVLAEHGLEPPVFILSAGADLHALTRADIEAMPE